MSEYDQERAATRSLLLECADHAAARMGPSGAAQRGAGAQPVAGSIFRRNLVRSAISGIDTLWPMPG